MQFNINYTRIEAINEQYGSRSAASRSQCMLNQEGPFWRRLVWQAALPLWTQVI